MARENVERVWAAELPDPRVDHGADALLHRRASGLPPGLGFRLKAEAFLPAPAAHVWTVRRGKAVRVEAYMDRAKGLEAAGLSEV